MNSSFTVIGLSTGIIRPHDPFTDRIIAAADATCRGFAEGDILILAETAVATAEGNVVRLDSVTPSPRAQELAEKYHMDPRTVEVVLAESDSVVGGIPGFSALHETRHAPPECRSGLLERPTGTASCPCRRIPMQARCV